MRWMMMGLIGAAGGIVSGLLGVGGGVLFVPLLVILLKIDFHTAVGTSLAVIVPTALAGALKHFSSGQIDLKMAGVLAVFAIAGAWFGAGLSLHLDALLLRRLFSVFLVLLAVHLFFTS